MKYKVGDRVRIKSLDWYNENRGNADKTNSVWCKDGAWFFYHMSQYCGKIMTIENVWANSYTLEGSDSRWTDEMIEGLVEDEMIDLTSIVMETVEEKTIQNALAYGYNLPDGYQFKDEDGNVINTQKIVLEKKKKEYPKTLGECRAILGIMSEYGAFHYKTELITTFMSLLICRDAYWKIAGEQMGLGKPWEPNWGKGACYTICCNTNQIVIGTDKFRNSILVFPTEEMRDAFYENFKELINECKELL